MHTDGRQDVHLAVEQFLEVLTEGDEIQQGALWVHVDQQVDIAVRPILAAGNRTKETQVARTVCCCEPDDLVPLALQIHGTSFYRGGRARHTRSSY